jgi:hypothetical protein
MRFPAVALTIACVLMAVPETAFAKGAGHGGGGHGGGHSAGHSSGGHSPSSGHASSRSNGSGNHRPAQSNATARGRTHIGQPGAETAVPRPATLPTFPIGGGLAPLASFPLFGLYGGFGYSTYVGAPFGYPDATNLTGGLRLDVEPESAEVFVDGYYAGVVDDFNGRLHHLNLAPGPHHVEVFAPGYQPLAFDLLIQRHHTARFSATLAPSAP